MVNQQDDGIHRIQYMREPTIIKPTQLTKLQL